MLERNIYTPELIVAGAKEFGSVVPEEAAFNALAFTLDTESVAFVWKVIGDKVHYAGAPSSYFVSQGESDSPILQVLGSSNGAYIIDEAAYSILVIKTDDYYETYSATYDQVRQACLERDLDPVILTAESEMGTWTTRTYAESKRSQSVNARVLLLSGIVAIGCSVGWLFMAGSTGALKQSAYDYNLEARSEISKAINQIPSYQPVDKVMAELSIAKSVSAKSGGWINRFEVVDNETGFEIMMPAWVTREYIAPLGNVQAERDPDGLMIRVFRELEDKKQ